MKTKLFLVMALFIGMAFASLTVPGWTLSQDSYRPGAEGVITLTVSNPLVAGINVRSVQGINIDLLPPPQILVSGERFIGDIEPGGSTLISIPFKISTTASSAIYSLELKVSGISDRPEGGFDSFTRRIIIPVTVANEPIMIFNSDRQVIGGIDQLLLSITNNGGKAANVRIRIPEGSGVSLYGSNEVYLPLVSGTTPLNLTLDSRDAVNGPTDIKFLLEYEDELGIKRTDNSTLRLTVRNEKLDLTFNQMSDIITKKEGSFTLSIRNDATTELSDVRLSFPNNSFRLKDSGELKFGDIRPGETATATGTLFAELPPGVNSVHSQLSWIEKDVQKEELRQIPFTITSDADVGVYLEAKPLPLTIGSEHTISVLVSNLGSYRIENVDVSIKSPALQSLDISDRQYIGGLQNDDFSTVQFLMKVNSSSQGTYPVAIDVNYRDQSGDWKQKTLSQSISVYAPLQQDESPLPLLAVIGLVLIAIWYFKFRKA